jgi:hypothetical protein
MAAQPFLPPENDPLIGLEEREVPSAERERLTRQIEDALERRRAQVTPELLAVKPTKRGLLLPVVVNLSAAVLTAAGVLLLLWYFRMRQDTIALRAGTYLSAEGQLLQTFKRETDQRLRAKDAEIAAIQDQLRRLGEQSAALQASMEKELQARELHLQQDMEARLAAERERLASLGTSTDSIDRRLRELERQGQRQLGTEMDSYRRHLEAVVAEQELALQSSRQEARQALQQASRDRRELLEASNRREADIRAQFEQERRSLRTEALGAEERARAAEQELRSLSERTRTQELLEDQITVYYRRALAAVEARQPQQALAALDALEGLLQGEAVSALPDLADRRGVEYGLIAALRELIRAGSQGPGAAEGQEVLQAQLEQARRDIADQRRQIEGLEGRLRLAAQGSSEDARSAGATIRELEARAGRVNAQLTASEDRAARLEAQLESARADQAAAEQARRGAQESARAEGREAALKDVMRYLQYVSGSAEQKKALEGALLALVRQDPLYRAVTREIQLTTGVGARSPYVFLGVVASVSGGTIVVDPMVELALSAGTLVQVRRASELEREQTIGSGKVVQARAGMVTVVLDSGAAAPAVRDLIYVESRP